MCLLALFYRVAEDAPVVVGANREELYRRGGEPPRLLDGPIRAVAGIDPVAGGTWLGVNAAGVLVAVTNRRKSQEPERPRSRGLLARELLACPSAAAAVELATRELDTGRYAGCNFLCADADRAVVLEGADWLRVRPLPPGLHVMTNGDVHDERDARCECRSCHTLLIQRRSRIISLAELVQTDIPHRLHVLARIGSKGNQRLRRVDAIDGSQALVH